MTPPARPQPWTAPDPLPARFETERLTLRFFGPADAEALYRAIDHSRPLLTPWLPWAGSDHRDLHQTIFNIEKMRRAREERPMDDAANAVYGYVVGAFDRATGDLVGGTGYNRINRATHDAEVGYWVRGDRQRKGYCTEATAAIISWGLTAQPRGGWGFRRIRIFAAAENTASCGVPRKVGLREEMHAVRDRWVDGVGWSDTLGWAVVAEEWDIANSRPRA